MRVFFFILLTAAVGAAQTVNISVRPDAVYVETIAGNVVPMERVFFHIIIENKSTAAVDVQWVRFDVVNSMGTVISAQYSSETLMDLFDSAMDRRRIEPTAKRTLSISPDERKALSDIFMDFPQGFIGHNVVVEVDYRSGGKEVSSKISAPLRRMDGFSGRLPFDGVWYVSSEHGFLDAHKRFFAEAFAYDFLQIGANGKSFQRDGKSNGDYYAYGKKVLAAKDGTVVFLRTDIVENVPGETTNTTTPSGNVVIIDHGNSQYGYYAHLKPFSVSVKVGAQVRAGDSVGEVGNSGDSLEPHLHFHVMNNMDANAADGIPVLFESWKAESYSRFPAARQLGVLPRGEFVQP
jgi:murein DD-endopeptidase MepM/ murein hydrolase activator NlpD